MERKKRKSTPFVDVSHYFIKKLTRGTLFGKTSKNLFKSTVSIVLVLYFHYFGQIKINPPPVSPRSAMGFLRFSIT